MLMQISVLISAYQMPSTRVQPLVGRPASIGGRAMPLRMHQAEAPLRRALHTIVLTTHAHARVLRAVSEWSVASQFRALGRCHAPQSGARRLLQQHMVRRLSDSLNLSPPEDTQFPTRSMPAGRYAVAFSEQLGVDDVFSTRLWGEPVVLYRDARKEVWHKN